MAQLGDSTYMCRLEIKLKDYPIDIAQEYCRSFFSSLDKETQAMSFEMRPVVFLLKHKVAINKLWKLKTTPNKILIGDILLFERIEKEPIFNQDIVIMRHGTDCHWVFRSRFENHFVKIEEGEDQKEKLMSLYAYYKSNIGKK